MSRIAPRMSRIGPRVSRSVPRIRPEMSFMTYIYIYIKLQNKTVKD